MKKKEFIDLNLDLSKIKNHEDYKGVWQRLGKIEIKMVEKHEECKHNMGDTFLFENPYKRPKDVCEALLHVLDLYTWRVALGFPSWNSENRKVFKLHCPDPKGTIWEMRKKRNDTKIGFQDSRIRGFKGSSGFPSMPLP